MIVNGMGRINNNNLIYVNIQQPSGSDCSLTVKKTATIEYYNYPFYSLHQLKALKWKVKSNRTLRIIPPTTCKVIRHLRIQIRKPMGLKISPLKTSFLAAVQV